MSVLLLAAVHHPRPGWPFLVFGLIAAAVVLAGLAVIEHFHPLDVESEQDAVIDRVIRGDRSTRSRHASWRNQAEGEQQ